jgi:hypothetical protein
MVVGRPKRRKPAEERVDVLAIAQAHLLEAQARLSLGIEEDRRVRARIEEELASLKALVQTLAAVAAAARLSSKPAADSR